MNEKFIRIKLLEKDVRAKDMAKAIGVSEATLSKNIRGLSKASLTTALKIARYLEVKLEDIL